MLKLICFVKRNPALSAEQFHQHWRDVHAPLIRNTPSIARHLLSYQQNPRAAADYARGEPDWDGVAIACYADRAAMEALFNEPDYHAHIALDERYLSDPDQTQWILCEEERQVIG